jgi:hypothetical protein
MGHSMTLDEDCTDRTMIERHLLQLSERVGQRLRRGGYRGRTVTLTIRHADFHTFSKQRRLQHTVNHGLDIYAAAAGLLRELPLQQAVRLVGVSMTGLERNAAQMPLFTESGSAGSLPRPWMTSTTGTDTTRSPGARWLNALIMRGSFLRPGGRWGTGSIENQCGIRNAEYWDRKPWGNF